jgi:hypothetical protein
MGHRSAQLFLGHVLAGDGLHDVGAGDEHVRDALHHEDEVGHRRGVNGTPGTRPEHHADLRHDARCFDVPEEDPAVSRQGDDALLDSRAAAVVEPDERRADRLGEVHHLVDLLGVHLAQRAAEQREVLREDEHLPTADRAPPGHDTVGQRAVLLDAEPVGAMAGEHVELDEGPGVEEQLEPLAREQLAPLVLPLDRRRAPGVDCLLAQLVELLEALLDGVRDRRDGRARPAFALDLGIFDGHSPPLAPSQARALR